MFQPISSSIRSTLPPRKTFGLESKRILPHEVNQLTDHRQSRDDQLNWSDTVEVSAQTDVGMRRANNQDSLRVVLAESDGMWRRQGHLFLVADGMGAHAAGELASKMAVDLIPHHYSKYRELPPAEALLRAFEETNSEIYRRGQSSFEFHSMGTTCCALALLPEGAVVAHVGDSRVYQLDGQILYQLTFDHSLVWEMHAAGRVSDEAARSGVIPKNVITRSLGPNSSVLIDLEGPFPVRKGSRFLLCSDGLSGQISDEEIAIILFLLPPSDASQFFIDLSNLRGGPDNITAVVVEATDDRLATRSADPLSVGRASAAIPFSKSLAFVAAVCLVIALALASIGQAALAVITTLLGVFALGTGVIQFYRGRHSQESLSGRYGEGPHRSYSAKATQTFFEYLAGTMQPLREASDEKNWRIDWTDLNQQFAAACRSADTGDYAGAIRIQAHVIISLMHRIRSQRNDSPGESDLSL
jgi:PPM family protein phosphatase